MATQGPNGGAGAGAGWAGLGNIAATDAIYATQSVAGTAASTSLSTSTLGFTIPAGATINGITVAVVRHASATGSLSITGSSGGTGISLTKVAATPTGTAKLTGGGWGLVDATDTFGNAADLWGTTWTPADINSTGFGAILQVDNTNVAARTASVDSILITVTFTPAVATATSQMFMVF